MCLTKEVSNGDNLENKPFIRRQMQRPWGDMVPGVLIFGEQGRGYCD
jgi:hypothetical protein